MKSIFKLSVRGYELDSFGHVNNAVYLQYAEAAKWDFFYKSGMIDEMKANNLFPVILENKLRYMHELRMMVCITYYNRLEMQRKNYKLYADVV